MKALRIPQPMHVAGEWRVSVLAGSAVDFLEHRIINVRSEGFPKAIHNDIYTKAALACKIISC